MPKNCKFQVILFNSHNHLPSYQLNSSMVRLVTLRFTSVSFDREGCGEVKNNEFYLG